MKFYILLIILLVFGSRLWAQEEKDPQNMPVKPENTDCQELGDNFHDLEGALTAIKRSRFYYEQKIRTTRKSGLMEASYYSCDFKSGYLIIRYDSAEQLYWPVDMTLWERFQKSPDIDGFYIKEIKDLTQITYHE